MVNIPGSSKRCNECRQRRVKCGLEQPSCARCVKKGIRCSGPREGPTFVHRDTSNMRNLSDRKNLIAAIRNESASPPPRSASSSSPVASHRTIPPQEPKPALPMTSSLDSPQDFYQCVLQDFQTRIFDCHKYPANEAVEDSISNSCLGILPYAFRNKALDAISFASLTMYLSRFRGDSNLFELGMSAYPTALRYFRPQLPSSVERSGQRDIMMAVCLGMQLFEWLADPNHSYGEGYIAHVDGALDILKAAGPRAMKSEMSRAVFSAFRWAAIWKSINSRKAIFLAESSWMTIPYELSPPKTTRELLQDLMIHIPGLLERTDQLKASVAEYQNLLVETDEVEHGFESTEFHQSLDLLRAFDALFMQLDRWEKTLHTNEEEQLWCYSKVSDAGTKSHIPQENIPLRYRQSDIRRSPMLLFQTPRIAGLLIVYWTALLELSTAVLEIRKLFDHGFFRSAYRDYLGSDSPSMNTNKDRPDKLALRLCMAGIFLATSINGVSIAYGPVTFARRHFRRVLAEDVDMDEEVMYSDGIRRRELAQIGLECSHKALDMLLKTLGTAE